MIGIIVHVPESDGEKYKFILRTKSMTMTSNTYRTIDLALRSVKYWESRLQTSVRWSTGKTYHKFIPELLGLQSPRRIRIRKKSKNDMTYIVIKKRKAIRVTTAIKEQKQKKKVLKKKQKEEEIYAQRVAWITSNFVSPRIKIPTWAIAKTKRKSIEVRV